jgi:hypothetical protein
MAAQPFESRIQDLVYNVDSGIGLYVIKVLLYCLFIGFIVLLYSANQFKGLRDAEAMDYAQLGRNVTFQSPWLVTQNIRPASVWYLEQQERVAAPLAHPDIVHAPLYPLLLRLVFTGADFTIAPQRAGQIFGPEHRVMVLNHLFSVLTGIVLFPLARRLFDRRIALLGLTVYVLSDTVWSYSLSGTGVAVAAFFGLSSIYAMVVAVSRIDEDRTSRRWLAPVIWSAVFCGLAFLARYSALVLVPGLLLYLAWALRGRALPACAIFLAVFLLPAGVWMARNVQVSGSPLGLAPYMALNDSADFPGNTFERSRQPGVSFGTLLSVMQTKVLTHFRAFYEGHLMTFGDGLLMAFFLVTFFFRFVRFPVHALRWGLLLSMFLMLIIGAVYGESTFRLLLMFWPLVILYALAFFTLLLDRLQLQLRLANQAITTALILLTALPLIFTLLPPRARIPYPPYSTVYIHYMSNFLRTDELLSSDMSWATAWYGDRTSVLLPFEVKDFIEMHDFDPGIRFHGLHFSTLTRDQPLISVLRSPAYVSWWSMLEGRPPADFPLRHIWRVPDIDHLFISDRARWMEQ